MDFLHDIPFEEGFLVMDEEEEERRRELEEQDFITPLNELFELEEEDELW